MPTRMRTLLTTIFSHRFSLDLNVKQLGGTAKEPRVTAGGHSTKTQLVGAGVQVQDHLQSIPSKPLGGLGTRLMASIYPSIHLSICLSVYLSICLVLSGLILPCLALPYLISYLILSYLIYLFIFIRYACMRFISWIYWFSMFTLWAEEQKEEEEEHESMYKGTHAAHMLQWCNWN